MKKALSTSVCSLRLLGPFQIENQGQAVTLPRKARALLAYIAMAPVPMTRHELASTFCGEAVDPARTLRSLLSRIRAQMAPELLQTEADTITFDTTIAWIDCLTFAAELNEDPVRASTLALFRGDFLTGFHLPDAPEFELWLLGRRAHYRQLYELGLTRGIRQLIERDRYTEAIDLAQALTQSNPLFDEGYAWLIWLYARLGQRTSALAQYEQCRSLLARELGVEPSTTLRHLYEEILSGRFESLDRPHHHPTTRLPPKRGDDPFAGRSDELDQLMEAGGCSRQ